MTGDFHSKAKRFDVTLTVFSSFFDEKFAVTNDHSDKTFVAEDVATLGVGIGESAIGEFSQTAILAFYNEIIVKILLGIN